MDAKCNDCEATAKGTKSQLTDLGWMGVQTWIKDVDGKKAYIAFKLCPEHAKAGRFVEVLNEKAKQLGIDLTEKRFGGTGRPAEEK